jgi:hypothetical protein
VLVLCGRQTVKGLRVVDAIPWCPAVQDWCKDRDAVLASLYGSSELPPRVKSSHMRCPRTLAGD